MSFIEIALDKVIKARNNAYTAMGMDNTDDMIEAFSGIIDLLEEVEDELLEACDED